MAETTRKLAASTRRQFFFVASTTASTRGLVQNFQLICFSQRVNATSQYNNVAVRDVQNGRTGWDRCSGETSWLLVQGRRGCRERSLNSTTG